MSVSFLKFNNYFQQLSMTLNCKMRSIHCRLLSPTPSLSPHQLDQLVFAPVCFLCNWFLAMWQIFQLNKIIKLPLNSIHKHTDCPARLTNNHSGGLEGCQPFIITGNFLTLEVPTRGYFAYGIFHLIIHLI